MSTPNTLSLEPGSLGRTASGPAFAGIGPNAVLQLLEALRALSHGDLIERLLLGAGVGEWLEAPPGEMVDERPVGRMHQAVRVLLPPSEAHGVMVEAGRRTGDYLLTHRIPRAAQAIPRLLPPSFAAEILVRAIRANAWTFAGSSHFEARSERLGGSRAVFTLTGNPLCAGETNDRPVCAWHEAVFQRLFETLVSPRARVTETHCGAAGDAFCRFVVHW